MEKFGKSAPANSATKEAIHKKRHRRKKKPRSLAVPKVKAIQINAGATKQRIKEARDR